MIQTSSLVVAEEEQLVLDDRPANRASEHVPTQLRCCNHPIRSPYSQTVLPLIRVEDVVAEVLEGVAMERIRARLDRRVDDAALVVSEFRGRILSNQIEFLIASGDGVRPRRFSETWLLSSPSSRKLLACSRFPLIYGRPPPSAVFEPRFKLLVSTVTAPGERSVNCTGLRVASGRLSFVLASMIVLTCVVSVCRTGASPVTSTVSDTWPTFICASTRAL